MKKFKIIMKNNNGGLDSITIKCNRINEYTLTKNESKISINNGVEIAFSKQIQKIVEIPINKKDILQCKILGKDLSWLCHIARSTDCKYVLFNDNIYETNTYRKICNANEIEE